jgi:hypothetical protein
MMVVVMSLAVDVLVVPRLHIRGAFLGAFG